MILLLPCLGWAGLLDALAARAWRSGTNGGWRGRASAHRDQIYGRRPGCSFGRSVSQSVSHTSSVALVQALLGPVGRACSCLDVLLSHIGRVSNLMQLRIYAGIAIQTRGHAVTQARSAPGQIKVKGKRSGSQVTKGGRGGLDGRPPMMDGHHLGHFGTRMDHSEWALMPH